MMGGVLPSGDGHQDGALVGSGGLARRHPQVIGHDVVSRVPLRIRDEQGLGLVGGQHVLEAWCDHEAPIRKCEGALGVHGNDELLGDLVGMPEIAEDLDVDANRI